MTFQTWPLKMIRINAKVHAILQTFKPLAYCDRCSTTGLLE